MRVEGQSVFVIGGSSGIGLEIARHASRAGANVTIGSRSREKLDAARSDIGGDIDTVQVDVVSDDSVIAAFEKKAGYKADMVAASGHTAALVAWCQGPTGVAMSAWISETVSARL